MKYSHDMVTDGLTDTDGESDSNIHSAYNGCIKNDYTVYELYKQG